MMGPKKGEENVYSLKEIDSSCYRREGVKSDEIPTSLREESLKGRIINLETLFPVWDDESIQTEDFSNWSDDCSLSKDVRYPHIVTPYECKSLGSLLAPKYDETGDTNSKGKLINEAA